MTEHSLQKAVVEYIRYAVPGGLLWATPNGGKRDAITGRRLKAEGVLAGVPDLTLLTGRGLFFIELKVGRNRPTEAQNEFMEAARALGAGTAVCWCLDDVEKALRAWRLIK